MGRLALVRLRRRRAMSVALALGVAVAVALAGAVSVVEAATAEAGLQETLSGLGPDGFVRIDQQNLTPGEDDRQEPAYLGWSFAVSPPGGGREGCQDRVQPQPGGGAEAGSEFSAGAIHGPEVPKVRTRSSASSARLRKSARLHNTA
jgi:hypothetical protein